MPSRLFAPTGQKQNRKRENMGELERYNGKNGRTIAECEIHGDSLHVTKDPFSGKGYFGCCSMCGKTFYLNTESLEEQFNV